MRSEEINEISAALAKAQKEMKAAKKSGKNPHFNSRYSTMQDLIDAAKSPLASNGLSITQLTSVVDNGILLETFLMHTSGQWLQSEWPLEPLQKGPQALGSVLTYARRYCYESILGLDGEVDDDGNAADKPQAKPATNGNGHKARKPGDFMVWVNRQIKDEANQYKHLKHLFNAVREISTLDDFEWPKANDDDGWRKCAEWGKELIAAKNAAADEQPASIESEGKGKDHYDD